MLDTKQLRVSVPTGTAFSTQLLFHGLMATTKITTDLLHDVIQTESGSNRGLYKIAEISGHKLWAKLPAPDDVPIFLHPVHDMKNNNSYIDLRSFINKFNKIKNTQEALAVSARAVLEIMWIESRVVYHQLARILIETFSNWGRNQLGKHLNLTTDESTKAQVVCAWYYALLILQDSAVTTDEAIPLVAANIVTRNTGLPGEYVNQIFMQFDSVGFTRDILDRLSPDGKDKGSLLEVLAKGLDEILDARYSIKPTTLFKVMTGGYMGAYANQINAAAIESPPTFLFCLMNVNGNARYNKTSLGLAYRMGGHKQNHLIETVTKQVNTSSNKVLGINSGE